jgi:nicotinamide mononucleotide transporter
MVQTGIFVYILFVYGLLGDMVINAYYFLVSIIGWYLWTRKVDDSHYIPITKTTTKEKLWSVLLFVGTLIFVTIMYLLADRFDVWTDYVDTLTTAIFFVGMWLMANVGPGKRRLWR